jgi:hypothetical protein
MTNDIASTRGSLAIARARQRLEGLEQVRPTISPEENTVVIGDTSGLLSPLYHWDEQIRFAHEGQGRSSTPCGLRHVPAHHVDHIVVASDALASQSTPEELAGWVHQLAKRSQRISLLTMTPGAATMALDEELLPGVSLAGVTVSITIRRDFYRQLEWEWIRVHQASETEQWATCRRWFYPAEVEALLDTIGLSPFRWVQREANDRISLGVIEATSRF